MDLVQRFPLLLTSPDHATADLREYQPLRDGFMLVSVYALISSVGVSIDSAVETRTVGWAVLALFTQFVLVYFQWVAVAGFFHLFAIRLGGLGEFLDVLGSVGLASAPMILVSIVSFLINVAEWTIITGDPANIVPLTQLILSLLGLAWGWPGVICYYVLKNVELVAPLRAAMLSAAGFLLLAAFQLHMYYFL